MSKKKKKVRKMRGSRTHGYGSKKKHRGKGSKGGKGYAGSHKHKYIKIVKYEPWHFGKKGFVSLKKKDKIINIVDLVKISEKINKDVIDLSELGYDKLLAKGKIDKKIHVKVKKISKKAKEKIEKAGGTVEILGEETKDMENK